MIRTRKINNVRVVPPPQTRKIRNFCQEMLPRPFANVWFCAKTDSGKTVTLFTMLKYLYKNAKKRKKNFILVPFAGKAHKDPTWQQILEYFENKAWADIWEQDEELPPEIMQAFNVALNEQAKDPHTEYYVVFDDMGKKQRMREIYELIKSSRHYNASLIFSAQRPSDLHPDIIGQLDVVILFGGHPEDKLEFIYNKLDLGIDLKTFLKLYRMATARKYNFLYIDVTRGKFRKNYDKEIVIRSSTIRERAKHRSCLHSPSRNSYIPLGFGILPKKLK